MPRKNPSSPRSKYHPSYRDLTPEERQARMIATARANAATHREHISKAAAERAVACARFNKAITPDLAAQFVKFLGSGFSCTTALDTMFPTRPPMNRVQRQKWHVAWLSSPLVLDATTLLNGGRWEDLDHDQQIVIALDHLDCQMARFLYTTDYNAKDAPLAKIADARTALMARIKSKEGNESPWEKAMRDLLEGKMKSGPPQLAALPAQPKNHES